MTRYVYFRFVKITSSYVKKAESVFKQAMFFYVYLNLFYLESKYLLLLAFFKLFFKPFDPPAAD
jgi:hypothetical protein